MERVRCQFPDAMLAERYWAEATSYTVYTLNKCPHNPINFLTPEERWSGKPPKLNHLKVFGCIGYVHQNQGKLKARAAKYMLGLLKELKGIDYGIQLRRDALTVEMLSLENKRCLCSKITQK